MPWITPPQPHDDGPATSAGPAAETLRVDWAGLSTPVLIQVLEDGMSELSTRMTDPHLRDVFTDYQTTPKQTAQDWGINTESTSSNSTSTGTDDDCAASDAAFDGGDQCGPRTDPTTGEPASATSTTFWCSDPASTMPGFLKSAERLNRHASTVRTRLAGIAAEAFTDETRRPRVLGLPAGKTVYKNPADYLRQTTQLSLPEAKHQLAIAAGILATEPDPVTNTPRPPTRPDLAAATTKAEVTTGGAWIITRTLNEFAHTAATTGADHARIQDILARGEKELTTHAETLDDDGLAAVAKRWQQRSEAELGYDGDPPNEETARAKRGLKRLHKDRYGNTHYKIITGDADAELIETILHAANNPAARHHTNTNDGTGNNAEADGTSANTGAGHDVPTGAGSHAVDDEGAESVPVEDDRTWAQKALDGFLAVLTAGFQAPEQVLSDHGGSRPQINVTIDLHTMLHQAHVAGLLPVDFDLDTISEYGKPGRFLCEGTHTGPMRPSEVRRLLCDAEIVPVVLGGNGEVLDVGTKRRFFDGYIRRAIGVRDGGCAAPGCTAPLSWCQAHHVIPARDNGPTSVENGVMLCRHDHALADAGEWEITFEHGVPYFTAPKYRDPSQTPRRNTYWRQQFF